MPTRPTKGGHGHGNQGSQNPSGPQKATQGSSVSEVVAEDRREVTGEQDDRTGPRRDDS
jgi:hypothetical protein